MNLLREAVSLYESQGWEVSDLLRDIIEYNRIGGMILTSEMFILFRSVSLEWGEKKIVDFCGEDSDSPRDCWYAHLAIGVKKDMRSLVPYYLPYFCYVHKDRFKIIPTNKFYGQKT
jgi:hypothetical protein